MPTRAVEHGSVRCPADDGGAVDLVGEPNRRRAVGDPARDLAFLLGSTEFGSVDEAFDAHSAARGIGDRQLRQRAMLHAELDVARWLLHGVDSGDQAIVADATGMLTSLVRRVDRDPGTAIAAHQPETMDLTGVQQYLGETGPVDGASHDDADRAPSPDR